MKAAIYTRVSTDEQDTGNQRLALDAIVNQREYKLYRVYSENESAWKAGHQAELARLIADAKAGRFEVLVVFALDRLSRQGSLAILSLWHKLQLLGVTIVSLNEPWAEAPGELGEILYSITGWVARMESTRKSQNTKAGMANARIHGTKSGIPIGKRGKDKHKRTRRTRRELVKVRIEA